MSINLSMPELTELHPKITVFGVGGAGGNAVGNMIRASLAGVEFVVANTDAQALSLSPADRKIQLGVTTTLGLGAGSRPDVGRAAAEEAMDQIVEQLTGSHMVFITAGMGGGTGTGASPIIAKVARDQGILTVGVVTKPFQFEGNKRMRMAEEGIQQLQEFVDTLIVIPNQNLFRIATEKTTFADAFAMADDVLHSGVRGITDLMVMPGLINLDFADVRTVMSEMGKAMMGTGEAEGERRALEAAEAAITNPLLDDVSLAGARGLLINITGGMDLTLYEVDEAANRIRSEVDSDANIIVGSTFDESTNGKIRVSVVATGIDVDEGRQIHPAIQVTSLDRSINHEVLPQVLEERRQVLARIKESQANTPANVLERELDAPASGDDTHGAQESVPADRSTLLDGEREEERVAPAPTPENLVHNTPEEPPQVVLPQTAEDPFIAPKPMRVDRDPETGSLNAQDRARTDTATRSQTEAVDKREPSLFERVTGSVKARRVEKKEEAARDDGSAPNLFGKVERSGVQTSAAVDQSGDPFSLGTPDPADRIVPTRTLRDQLDIPAFLRRQAN